MVVKGDFEEDGDEDHQHFDADQQPDLHCPLLEEESMHHSFQEGSKPEHKGHQHIGWRETVHVGEEVPCMFAILVVVAEVAADSDQNDDQHEQGCADLEDGGDDGVAEEDLEGSEA